MNQFILANRSLINIDSPKTKSPLNKIIYKLFTIFLITNN
jgi:hypothetical protein